MAMLCLVPKRKSSREPLSAPVNSDVANIQEHEDGIVAPSPEEASNLAKAGFTKCANPRCDFWINDETVHDYYKSQGGVMDRQLGEDNETWRCPRCGTQQYLLATAPFAPTAHEAYTFSPGNRHQLTTSGLTSRQMGEVAENILKSAGSLEGYGPIVWWSEDYWSPLDGATSDWGLEIKGIDFAAQNHRFVPGKPRDKYKKNEMAEQMGLKGILGVLIVLDFRRSVADIYAQEYPVIRKAQTAPRSDGGALSFGGHWPTHLKNDWHQGVGAFWKHSTSAMHLVKEVPFQNPFSDPNNYQAPIMQNASIDADFPEWLKAASIFDPNTLSQPRLQQLRAQAESAWHDDTRHESHQGHPLKSAGQCYVTSRWLQHKLGGYVGRKAGHYFWVSPDLNYGLDLTGDQFAYSPHDLSRQGIKIDENHDGLKFEEEHGKWRPGPILYKSVDHPLFSGYELVDNDDYDPDTVQRVQRFYDRAEGRRTALDYAGDAFPAQEPEAAERLLHDDPTPAENNEYKFFYGNGDLHVSPLHDWDELQGHAKVGDDYAGPTAVGHVSVNAGTATWEVSGNIGAHALARVFKDYSKHVGWKWGGLTSLDGEPIGTGSEFKPVKSYYYAVIDGDLKISSDRRKLPELHGCLPAKSEKTVQVTACTKKILPALLEWAEDHGFTLVGGNDNVIKTIEDLEQDNIYDPNADQHSRQPGGVFKCPDCEQIFPRWELYLRHRRTEEPSAVQPPDNNDDFFQPDLPLPPHQTEQRIFHEAKVHPATSREAGRVEGFRHYAETFGFNDDDHSHYVAYWNGAPVGYATVKDGTLVMVRSHIKGVGRRLMAKLQQVHPELKSMAFTPGGEKLMRSSGWYKIGDTWKWAAGQQPKDLIGGAIPFLYDIQEDAIFVGQPGQRTSDIQGQFTPGGIVEGNYEPGGKVFVRSMTNMPYTVRHMLELWYYQHPELEVTQVKLQDDAGNETRLAGHDIGGFIKALVAADPDTHRAAQALERAGGRVYVVGGAVRDALLNKEPKDLDLMVTGLPADEVQKALSALPGRMDYTGKDFGVFRYNGDVEVALPRTEKSTGGGFKDFDVHADHNLSPEEDLFRRDFTVNAMAIDLQTGQLIDPYGGLKDTKEKRLRTLHTKSLSEDPLRTMRALVAKSKHGFDPDDETRAAMQANAPGLKKLPAERLQAELDKIINGGDPAGAIKLANETGVLNHFLPEVEYAHGYNQNNPHHELELGDHLRNVLDRVAKVSDDPDLRLAALLHDIGKPESAWVDPVTGKNHYYRNPETGEGADHEDVGATMAERRLRELKYPTERINRIRDLVQHHMYPAFNTTKGARRFLNRVGDHADDLLKLRWADQGGKSEHPRGDEGGDVDTQRQLIEQVRAAGEPTGRANLAVTGSDLIAWGYPAGPQLGAILNHLTQAVVDDPSLNNPEDLRRLTDEYTAS
jgi:tRNA nucleotidyltransferase (CCA-adding enzyme)